jgi:DNA-binding NtrC family response regulator
MDTPGILIIDNDPVDIEILKSAIVAVDPGAKCLILIFPEEALWLLMGSMQAPHFIFIDVNMYPITGPECLKTLRANRKFIDSKIVMFSGVMPVAVGEAFIQLGAFDYFQKPLDPSAYREIIGGLFTSDIENPRKCTVISRPH